MDGEAYLGYSVPDRNDDYSGYFHGLANGGPVLHQKWFMQWEFKLLSDVFDVCSVFCCVYFGGHWDHTCYQYDDERWVVLYRRVPAPAQSGTV